MAVDPWSSTSLGDAAWAIMGIPLFMAIYKMLPSVGSLLPGKDKIKSSVDGAVLFSCAA